MRKIIVPLLVAGVLMFHNVTLPEPVVGGEQYRQLPGLYGYFPSAPWWWQTRMFVGITYDYNDIWKSGSWKDCQQQGLVKISETWCGAFRVDRDTVDLGYNFTLSHELLGWGIMRQDCWFRQRVSVYHGNLRWGDPRFNCGSLNYL